MAIKIDPKDEDGNFSSEGEIAAAKAIRALSEKESCLWGRLEDALFICLFPEKDTSACLKMAKRFENPY